MTKGKKQPKKKGLTDAELVEKYEAGKFDLKNAVKAAIRNPKFIKRDKEGKK